MASAELILGEFVRGIDDRFRITLPTELLDSRFDPQAEVVLAKEQPGCLSLWDAAAWQRTFEAGLDVIRAKIATGRLEAKPEAQMFGRLLSSRHRHVQLAARARLLIPEGFREFLRAEPGGEVVVIGAAVCIEIWHPKAWLRYLRRTLPEFRRMFDTLSS
jgi:MraZ protein